MTKQQAASLFLFSMGFGRHEISLRYIIADSKPLNGDAFISYHDLMNAISFLTAHGLSYHNNEKFYATDRAAMLWEMENAGGKGRKGKACRDQWLTFAKSLSEHYPDTAIGTPEEDPFTLDRKAYDALIKEIQNSPNYH